MKPNEVMTQEQLQEYYDKYKHYQADVVTLSLSLHDLIMLVRNVTVDSAYELKKYPPEGDF